MVETGQITRERFGETGNTVPIHAELSMQILNTD